MTKIINCTNKFLMAFGSEGEIISPSDNVTEFMGDKELTQNVKEQYVQNIEEDTGIKVHKLAIHQTWFISDPQKFSTGSYYHYYVRDYYGKWTYINTVSRTNR